MPVTARLIVRTAAPGASPSSGWMATSAVPVSFDVNEIAVPIPADSATVSPRFNERILALNLLAPITFAQAAYGVMKDQDEGGVILNISSVSGIRANPMGVAYGAAKAGLAMIEAQATQHGPAAADGQMAGAIMAALPTEPAGGTPTAASRVSATVSGSPSHP